MHMCVPEEFPSMLSNLFFVMSVVDGTMLVVLVLIRAMDNIRKYGANRTANQTMKILVEGSVLCFVG